MPPVGHTAQLCRTDDELVDSAVAFLRTGAEQGLPGVVLATAPHRAAIRQAVGGRLIEADADETLAQIMIDGKPSKTLFEQVAGSLIDTAGGPVYAYGELVSVLCERGEVAAAMELEELWNGLIAERPVTLHCGYHLDVFDLATQTGPLPHICRLHTQVAPAKDEARFSAAVERALTNVLGHERARDVYYFVSRVRKQRAPVAQEALRWLSTTMPRQAPDVLQAARQQYSGLRI